MHTQGQESGEDTFRAVINIFPYPIISSNISSASLAINKFGMIPWAQGNFRSKSFRMCNWADKLFSNFTSMKYLSSFFDVGLRGGGVASSVTG
ncbi:MAG TPA: hypothetical protein DDW17_06510 [Deltaproteobacteria bacterium]|nr:hypothetical protein [Deltaproteobacteria bacterium]